MKQKCMYAIVVFSCVSLGWGIVWSAPKPPYPQNATFHTLIKTPLPIEGLTGRDGELYTVGRNPGVGSPCPVWEIDLMHPKLKTVGYIAAPSEGQCSPSGLAFNADGDLFVTNGDKISVLTPRASKPTATVYATGVPGANGVAFKGDDLWVSDGTTGLGRVWKVGPGGGDCSSGHNCEVVFRIQPMNNATALGGQGWEAPEMGGVGRVNATLQGTDPNNGNPQNLVANGLAFNADGDLFVADTARGALWLVKFKADGTLKSDVNCDETFDPKTLCLDNVFNADPRLEGADGIALDNNGNVWVSANERNAIAIFGNDVSAEVFRNPVNPDNNRRNSSDIDNATILESPTSPFLLGTTFCTANSDFGRRDNYPNSGGEISPSGTYKGKISCMDQELTSSGLRLPRP